MKMKWDFFWGNVVKNNYSLFTNSFLLFVSLEVSKLCCSRVLRRFQRDKRSTRFLNKLPYLCNCFKKIYNRCKS